jgi:putrescine transport system substrate-binding protein
MAGHSGFDIVSTTTGFYGRQIRAGAYLPLDKSKLPNLRNIDPRCSRSNRRPIPGNRYAVPYLHAMNGFVYNVDRDQGVCPTRRPTALPCCSTPR